MAERMYVGCENDLSRGPRTSIPKVHIALGTEFPGYLSTRIVMEAVQMPYSVALGQALAGLHWYGTARHTAHLLSAKFRLRGSPIPP
jgi:hypothetical protein